MAFAGSSKIIVVERMLRCAVSSTAMSYTMVCEYLRRCVATNAAISASVRRAAVGCAATPTGTEPAISDTSATSAAVCVFPSMVRGVASSETAEETGGSRRVGARNCDNPLHSTYKTDVRTSPSGTSAKPSVIA
jgi:hypothetical protein